MSARQVMLKKKMDGVLYTIHTQTVSSLVQVGENNLDTELDNIRSLALNSVPIGTIIIWIGSNYPDGWLSLEGQEISRTTYSALFDIYGTSFGKGDGSTTFNLPNQNLDNSGDDTSQYKYIVKALVDTTDVTSSKYNFDKIITTKEGLDNISANSGYLVDASVVKELNDEITALKAVVSSGELLLKDATTDKIYSLYIDNSKLYASEVGVDSNTISANNLTSEIIKLKDQINKIYTALGGDFVIEESE